MRKTVILWIIPVLALSGCFPAQQPAHVYHNVYIQQRSPASDPSRENKKVIKRNKDGYLHVEEREQSQ